MILFLDCLQPDCNDAETPRLLCMENSLIPRCVIETIKVPASFLNPVSHKDLRQVRMGKKNLKFFESFFHFLATAAQILANTTQKRRPAIAPKPIFVLPAMPSQPRQTPPPCQKFLARAPGEHAKKIFWGSLTFHPGRTTFALDGANIESSCFLSHPF